MGASSAGIASLLYVRTAVIPNRVSTSPTCMDSFSSWMSSDILGGTLACSEPVFSVDSLTLLQIRFSWVGYRCRQDGSRHRQRGLNPRGRWQSQALSAIHPPVSRKTVRGNTVRLGKCRSNSQLGVIASNNWPGPAKAKVQNGWHPSAHRILRHWPVMRVSREAWTLWFSGKLFKLVALLTKRLPENSTERPVRKSDTIL